MASPSTTSPQEQLLNLSLIESTLFWTGLSFVILLLVIWKYVVPGMGGLLEERRMSIQGDIDKAETLRDEAQKAMAEHEKQLKGARKEAQNIVANAKSEAEKIIQTKTAELERDIAKRSEDARVSIEQAKSKAMRDVRAEVTELAIAAAEKIVSEEVDSKKAGKLTDALLKEMH
mgnify:FL=1